MSILSKVFNRKAKEEISGRMGYDEIRIQNLRDKYVEAEENGEKDAVIKKAEYYKLYAEYHSDDDAGRKAIDLYEECAEHGFVEAFRMLGHIYDEGEIVPEDKGKSMCYYEKALEEGDGETAYFLGQYYEEGEVGPKDLKRAAEVYRKGAELGAVDAKAELGIAYFEGKGVDKDYQEAFRFLMESFDEEENKGGYYLAVCYLNGLGTEMDERKGFLVLEHIVGHASCYKSDEAKELLMNCYEKGIGTAQDVKKAEEMRDRFREQDRQMSKTIKILADTYFD